MIRIGEAFWSDFKNQLPTRSLQIVNIFRFIASVVVGVGLVRLGTSQYDVGRLEYFIFITFFWSSFWYVGLKDALLSRYFDYDEIKRKYVFGDFYNLHILAAVIISVLLFLCFSFNFYFGLDLNGLVPYAKYVILYALLLILAGPLEFILHLLGRHKEVIIYHFIWFLAHVSLILYAMVARESIELAAILLCMLVGCKAILTMYYVASCSTWTWSLNRQTVAALFALPLIIQALIGVCTQFVDVYLVSYFFNTETVAIFRFGAKEIPLSTVLVSGLVAASIPMYKSDHATGLQHMKAEFKKIVYMLFPLGIVLIVISPFLYVFVYGEAYAQSATIFNIYILLLLSRVFTPHVVLYGHNKNWILVSTIFIEVCLNAILSLLFIKIFGLVGVAYASVIAYMFQKVALMIYTRRVLKVSTSQYTDWPAYIKCTAALLVVFCIVQYIYA